MKTLVLFLALFISIPAHAGETEQLPPTAGFILPNAIACKSLDDVRTMMKTAERYGADAFDDVLQRVGMERSGDQTSRCREVLIASFSPKHLRLVGGYYHVEMVASELDDVVVLKLVHHMWVRYIIVERIGVLGHTL